jgi:hypothetical protein
MFSRVALRLFGAAVAVSATTLTAPANADTAGACDVSPGEYTAWTGTSADLETASVFTPGVSEARCLKDIRSLGGFVVEDIFKDSKGRYADELGSYGKLVNVWPGEVSNTICNGDIPSGKRNSPGEFCTTAKFTPRPFAETSAFVNALDWKYANPVRYDPNTRQPCPLTWPAMGCFGDRCYDAACVNADGTLKACGAGQICKAGACVTGSPTSLASCRTIPNLSLPGVLVKDGQSTYYEGWNGLVFDLGGRANKVAIFSVNDHGPQPCESNEFTVFLTNNPASRDLVDDPGPVGPDPEKWNRAKVFKIYTHGWIDNPNCCASPKSCDPTKCTLPKPGDAPVLEGDGMTVVYALPCGIAFRYAAVMAGYDGKSLGDPTKGADRCSYHTNDAEIDAVAGLNDDESAICPDKDGDGFPSCECSPKPVPCDCVDDPAKNPDAAKYHPGAPQACDGPEYSCAPSPCPSGSSCITSQCLRPCDGGEFKCPGGFTCQSVTPDGGPKQDVCVPAPCGDAGVCKAGETCRDGKCVDLCAPPTKCPPAQVCRGGICLDPCGLVKCPSGETCYDGKCVLPCACLSPSAVSYPCREPTPACDKKTSNCVPPGCDVTTCPVDKFCVGTPGGPVCKTKCEDVVCPGKQVCDPVKGCVDKCDLLVTPCGGATPVCRNGVCVDALCANVDCDAPFTCREGKCVEADAGISFDSGVTDTGTAPDTEPVVEDASKGDAGWGVESPDKESGCRCAMPGARATSTLVGFAGFTFAAALAARRRRRR